MDASSPQPADSPPMFTSGAVSKFLADLPSRGFLSSSTVTSSNPGGMRVYICEHDTSPPESQQIRTDQTNILIRSLQLKKTEGSRKRGPERASDGRASNKRSNGQTGAGQEGSSNRTSDKDLYSLTVERLRALLKEQGLSTKGKKDELVARLRSANG